MSIDRSCGVKSRNACQKNLMCGCSFLHPEYSAMAWNDRTVCGKHGHVQVGWEIIINRQSEWCTTPSGSDVFASKRSLFARRSAPLCYFCRFVWLPFTSYRNAQVSLKHDDHDGSVSQKQDEAIEAAIKFLQLSPQQRTTSPTHKTHCSAGAGHIRAGKRYPEGALFSTSRRSTSTSGFPQTRVSTSSQLNIPSTLRMRTGMIMGKAARGRGGTLGPDGYSYNTHALFFCSNMKKRCTIMVYQRVSRSCYLGTSAIDCSSRGEKHRVSPLVVPPSPFPSGCASPWRSTQRGAASPPGPRTFRRRTVSQTTALKQGIGGASDFA